MIALALQKLEGLGDAAGRLARRGRLLTFKTRVRRSHQSGAARIRRVLRVGRDGHADANWCCLRVPCDGNPKTFPGLRVLREVGQSKTSVAHGLAGDGAAQYIGISDGPQQIFTGRGRLEFRRASH